MIKKNLALMMCGVAVAWAGIRARGDDKSDAVVREVRGSRSASR